MFNWYNSANLDLFCKYRCNKQCDEKLLQGAGSVSHEIAIKKATKEYQKYQQKTLSEAEKNYLESLKVLENKTRKK
ncbi:MAG TPA: hypothetical protein PKN48_02400 [Bacteroidales bacterium]|nr:hypothetical protein [Bacteroidales bacterium]